MIKAGDKVQFSPIIGGKFNPWVYTVVRVCEIPSCKEPVAWLDGKAGCVSLKALRKVQE